MRVHLVQAFAIADRPPCRPLGHSHPKDGRPGPNAFDCYPEWCDFTFNAQGKLFERRWAVRCVTAVAQFHPIFFEVPIRPENIEAWGLTQAALRL